MQNIFNHDFETIYKFTQQFNTVTQITNDVIDTNVAISKELSKIKTNSNFLPHALSSLAQIKPVMLDGGYSVTATLKEIPEVSSIEGQKVTRSQFLALLSLFYWLPFSSYVKAAQTTGAYNSAMPIFLLAQKRYNNIPYNNWNKEEPYMKAVLGRDLKDILTVDFPTLTEDEHEEARIQSHTSKGERFAFTDYRSNKTDYLSVNEIPTRFLKHMYLKTWIFAAPKTGMIVEPEDWDFAVSKEEVVGSDHLDMFSDIKEPVKDNLPF